MTNIRPEITMFLSMGPLPSEDADESTVQRFQDALERIDAPLTDEEATDLLSAFGPDNCFGLAWTLLHLIETAPGGAAVDGLDSNNPWIACLQERRARGRTSGRAKP